MIFFKSLLQERQQSEREIHALHQTIETLRAQVAEEIKKYERMHRDRNASVKNLTDAEKGARRQVDELMTRDATIIELTDQLERVTAESNKKSTMTQARSPPRSMTCVINVRAYATDWTIRQHSIRRHWKRKTLSWPTCESYSTPAHRTSPP